MRTTVTFEVDGTTVEGWFYPPAGPDPVPVVVLGHGLGYVKSAGLDAFAQRFAEAGYAALAFDYRSFGGSGGAPRQVLSVKRQLEDWDAAIAHARTLPGVDPTRVVVWGTSFGGGHALTLAATRDDLVAAIAQCPFTDGIASLRVVPTVTSLKVTWTAVRDLLARLFGRGPVYVAGSGVPGETALMTAPDAQPAMRVLTADAPDFENRMAGRAAVEVMLYGPGRKASDITIPVLAAVCDRDTVAPARTATRQLARSSAIEVRHHDVGHFDIYLGEPFEDAVSDYLAFLDRVAPIR